LRVELRHLGYHYPGSTKHPIQDVSMTLQPGEHVGIAGFDGSGKTTLLRLMAGLLDGYSGVVAYDGLALQDITTDTLGQHIGDNISHQNLFDGTVLQNLTLEQPHTTDSVAWALDLVGLRDEIYSRPQGLSTPLGIGTPLADNTRQKLLLARALVSRPRLLLLDNFLPGVEPAERLRILARVLAPENPWTVLLATNDVRVLALCPRLVVLRSGHLVADGPFEQIAQKPELQELFF
jgi:ABC-type bacteriocin/lantibiotic exporter with double-glycine peptidase domain